MKTLVGSKFGRRFLTTVLLLSLPVMVAGWVGIVSVTQAMRKQTHAMLRVASDGAEAQVREFLSSVRRTTESRAVDEKIRAALRSPNQAGIALNDLLDSVRSRMREVQEMSCLNLEGRVVASSSATELGRDESSSVQFERGRGSYFPGEIVREKDGVVRWRTSAPVKEPGTGQLLGVVVVGIDPGSLSDLTTGKRVLAQGAESQSFRMGETGETYVVDRNGYLLTESRFAPRSVLTLKVETEPVRAALHGGKETIADYKDYRGVPVTGATAILPDMGWVLVTEIDFSQAFAHIRRLRNALIGLGIAMGLLAAWIARRFAQGIINPLRATSDADLALALGDERTALVPEQGLPRDEIGEFIQQRNVNVRKLFEHERQLLKEQERRAEVAAALEGISYSMVHDMRAPLRAVMTFGDLLEEEAGGRLTETEKGFLARMKSSCHRMDVLICDMLRYSSLLGAEVPLTAVNVEESLERVIEENPSLRAQRARIEIQDGLPPVHGNAAVLEQCLLVLLDNAFKHTRPGVDARLRIWSETSGSWTRLLIQDNGTGISAPLQRKLFGIFQKGSTNTQGTGIGLALLRVAVERMEGRVGMTSQEGKGSCFWIELRPAKQPEGSKTP